MVGEHFRRFPVLASLLSDEYIVFAKDCSVHAMTSEFVVDLIPIDHVVSDAILVSDASVDCRSDLRAMYIEGSPNAIATMGGIGATVLNDSACQFVHAVMPEPAVDAVYAGEFCRNLVALVYSMFAPDRFGEWLESTEQQASKCREAFREIC